MDPQELPQIGHVEVEPEVIAAAGQPLSVLLDELDAASVEVEDRAPVSFPAPTDGWRVLHSDRATVLGAPIDDERRSWRVAHLEASSGRGRLFIHPDPQPLRPSRAERARGLRLRWASVTSPELDPDRLWVDIVNDGDRRWMPNGDGFHIGAAVVSDGRDGAMFAYVGKDNAVPLDPGEYARVRADFNESSLDGLKVGQHDLYAWLVTLPVRTPEPLLVLITPELLARRAAKVAERRPEPDRVAHMRTRVAMLRALVEAGERLPEVLAIVQDPSSDRERSIAGIAELLGCGPSEAQAVVSMQLGRLATREQGLLVRELRELEAELGTA